ncbi:N-6 DNA methylase [Novosphingobium naphthalenivorans]|nr:N-6 DNA methylase [Novosphingobium naphthalenivorans]
MEAIAIALSNAVDLKHREKREKRYLEIVGRYDRDIVETFPKILAEVVSALEAEPGDVLGTVYGELELHNVARGQFFTPYILCQTMAQAIIGSRESLLELIERNGFVSAMEPACGAGSLIIALAEAMRQEGVNYQQHLHVTAIDIDTRAVHMAYVQFTLMHIPAVVVVGNSLSMEMRDHWYTPAHILGGWSARLSRRDAEAAAQRLLNPPATPETAFEPADPRRADTTGTPRQLSLF